MDFCPTSHGPHNILLSSMDTYTIPNLTRVLGLFSSTFTRNKTSCPCMSILEQHNIAFLPQFEVPMH